MNWLSIGSCTHNTSSEIGPVMHTRLLTLSESAYIILWLNYCLQKMLILLLMFPFASSWAECQAITFYHSAKFTADVDEFSHGPTRMKVSATQLRPLHKTMQQHYGFQKENPAQQQPHHQSTFQALPAGSSGTGNTAALRGWWSWFPPPLCRTAGAQHDPASETTEPMQSDITNIHRIFFNASVFPKLSKTLWVWFINHMKIMHAHQRVPNPWRMLLKWPPITIKRSHLKKIIRPQSGAPIFLFSC